MLCCSLTRTAFLFLVPTSHCHQNTVQHVLEAFTPVVLVIDVSQSDALDYTGQRITRRMQNLTLQQMLVWLGPIFDMGVDFLLPGLHVIFALTQESKFLRTKLVLAGVNVSFATDSLCECAAHTGCPSSVHTQAHARMRPI